jgi:uncharacterized NAD(P)/FAD-binding protein YdhS
MAIFRWLIDLSKPESDSAGFPLDLFAIGPVRQAMLWETTAAPEVREQAASLAKCILSQRVSSVTSTRW